MNELSLFSGAGGGLLATKHLLGWKTVGYVEWEPYCQEVIKARIADGYLDPAPIFGDIRRFISEGYAELYRGRVDVVSGGFPCQDISSAGCKKGIEGERSGLWKSMFEVICRVRPRYVFMENSPMLTIRGLGTVLRDLAEAGFDARWQCISCADLGGVHLRERIWIVAYCHGERGRGFSEWKHQNHRNMGNDYTIRTFTDWNGIRFEGPREIFRARDSYPSILCRVDDGIPNRMERLRACGNAQVPIVAATAWRILTR